MREDYYISRERLVGMGFDPALFGGFFSKYLRGEVIPPTNPGLRNDWDCMVRRRAGKCAIEKCEKNESRSLWGVFILMVDIFKSVPIFNLGWGVR